MQTIDITKYKYISFDVFDTLIFRTFEQPEDIFQIIQILYKGYYSIELQGFKKKRIIAERKARALKIGKEITLNEIYYNLEYDYNTCERLKSIEIQAEVDNCVPNVAMIKFLKHCQSLNKKIVITTDMYLPRSFFEQLLKKLNIEVERIIISSEEGETKRTGKLYPILLKNLNIRADQVLHIGDNINNDIIQAKKNGINAVERWHNLQSTNENRTTLNITDNHIDTLFHLFNKKEYNQSAYHLGFSILGPLLYDFCTWIHNLRNERNIDKVLFLAREGYLISKCYKILYPEENNKIGYISLNKNLLRLPLLHSDQALSFFKDSLIKRDCYTWNQVFDILLIANDVKQRLTITKELGINYETPMSRVDLYNGLYDDKLTLLFNTYADTLNQQSELLLRYIKQNDALKDRIGLVNNSINGNGQFMLERYLKQHDIKTEIYGLQFVDSEKCKQNLGDRYSTYFDSLQITQFDKCEFTRNCLLFEHLLFEPIGTSLFFYLEGDHCFIKYKEQNQEWLNYAFVNEVQRFTLLFIDVYKNHIALPCNSIGIKRYLNYVYYPAIEKIVPVCSLWDEDSDCNRMIADLNIPLKWYYRVLRNIPRSIIWIEGYLAIKKVSRIWFKIIRLRLAFAFYRQHKTAILDDLKLKYQSRSKHVKN